MITKPQLVSFFIILLMASLVLSPFLLSVSMIGLAILSVVNIEVGRQRFIFEWDKIALNRLRNWRDYKVWLSFSIYFFIVLFSFWQTENANWGFWWERLRLKTPFLGLPLVFIALPPLSKQQLYRIFYIMIGIMAIIVLGVGINYILDFEAINLGLQQGHPIPTPRNHIRFSLTLAAASILGVFLYLEDFYWRSPKEKKWLLAITIFLIIMLHVLAVRTGILALYLGLGTFLLSYLAKRGKYLLATGSIIAIMSLPILAYNFVPSIKAKVGYMLHDFQMYAQGDGNIYADSGRIVSLIIGKQITLDNPIFGIGAGNLRAESKALYTLYYPQYIETLTPHNQFLYVSAGTGFIGLFFFVLAFLFPLFYRNNYKLPLFQAFYAIFFLMFVLEHTIENSIGIAYFIFLNMLLLSYSRIAREKNIP